MKQTTLDRVTDDIKVWHVYAAAGLSGLVAILALRNNYQTMVELRSKVFAADEQNGDVETALRDLREHIYNHMNTNLNAGANTVYPPIQLKYRYDRLVAEQKKAGDNSEVYSQAQQFCEQGNQQFSGGNRVACIEQYVVQNGGTPQTAIPESLYKFDFASPRWSPDLAGWSLVITVILLIVATGLAIKRRLSK